ncbi:MAG TPA: beta-N-acetylhexosaminidase [Verrucomicrobiae bacterium]|jgi:hexosaminidase|nr:beta-N-acetylhexosaminidase [Verrucomicrobiae bacterium]
MKHVKKILMMAAVMSVASAGRAETPSIIPAPVKMEVQSGSFVLPNGDSAKIIATPGAEDTAHYLADEVAPALGYKITIVNNNSSTAGTILLTTNDAKASLGEEGYELTVTPANVIIRAPTSAGLFYGVQSLLQLLPPEILSKTSVSGVKWEIPCVQIEDQPRFQWRGMMLDVVRHFFNKNEVEEFIDGMALHKMNRFHWHLVDDQGWRIEIKKYPQLTKIGAWRKGIDFKLDPKLSKAYGPDGRYGGFYTQDEIREVIAYAQARHIVIVPEIEMPGHSTAALMVFPELSCFGGPYNTDLPGGVFNGEFCTGNEQVYVFLSDVLAEVSDLFPGKYIHIGGDEVPTKNWEKCPKDQAVIKAEGLKGPKELESYFIRRIEKIVNSHNKTLIGWSEIREGGLAQSAVVMDWVGGAVEAASAGHDVVMSPLKYSYFDHYQSTNHTTEPHAIGGYLPMKEVYEFEPIPAKLDAQYASHILGAQANIWTEYMPNIGHVEYMAYPRLCALCEVVWSPKAARDWNNFSTRLPADLRRLDAMGLTYRHDPPQPLPIMKTVSAN